MTVIYLQRVHKSLISVLPYGVIVRTGSRSGADSEVNVHAQIFGKRGDTGVRKLLKSVTPPPEDGLPAGPMFSPGKVSFMRHSCD